MRTSAPAGRHVRLVPTTASRLAHAALPDRDQAGVGLDQALRAEPGRLERDPNIQAGAIHTLDHPLLHGPTPWWGHPMELQPRTAVVIARQAQPPSLDRLGPLEPRVGNSVQAITTHRRGSSWNLAGRSGGGRPAATRTRAPVRQWRVISSFQPSVPAIPR